MGHVTQLNEYLRYLVLRSLQFMHGPHVAHILVVNLVCETFAWRVSGHVRQIPYFSTRFLMLAGCCLVSPWSLLLGAFGARLRARLRHAFQTLSESSVSQTLANRHGFRLLGAEHLLALRSEQDPMMRGSEASHVVSAGEVFTAIWAGRGLTHKGYPIIEFSCDFYLSGAC